MINDLLYAFRQLVKTPAFTFVALLTLALGIGANSAIFSVIDTVLLRPLAFKNPDELVMLWNQETPASARADRRVFSFPDYTDVRDASQSFVAMAAFIRDRMVLTQGDESQALDGVSITSDVFKTLDVVPAFGRAYSREDDKIGAPPVVVLTHEAWQRVFGSDPKIVGKAVKLSTRSFTVIGVMPPGFKFPVESNRMDYLMPLNTAKIGLGNRGAHFMPVVARLKPGVSARQAEAEATTIAARLAKQYPDTNTNFRAISVVPLRADLVGDVRPALIVLLGAVTLVLLIACANVANLLLARGAARSRELAIRTALGASRLRIVRQLLCESLVLALFGGIGGLLLAWWGVDLLRSLGPHDVPRLSEISVNANVCAFTFVVAILSTLVFGLVPALQVSRGELNKSLQQGSKGSTGGLHSNRVRAFLVISQVAVSLLLLAGAGLLIKSFFNLQHTDLGFTPDRVMTASISLPRAKYPQPDLQVRALERLMDRLSTLPGVEAMGGVNPLPLNNNIRESSLTVSGAPPLAPGEHPGAGRLLVAGDYFRAMQIRLLRGRAFDRQDTKDSPLVVMVNEAFAKKFFPDRDPLTQQVMVDQEDDKAPPCQVVGVVANTRHDSVALEPGPEFYLPLAQDGDRHLDVVFRTSAVQMTGLYSAVKNAVHGIDPDIFVPQLRPMESYLAEHLARPRFNMLLLAVFAGVALVLAAIGIYGVIAYSVTQRTREIGIRMALGAQRTDMMMMVLRQSFATVGIGLLTGLLSALLVTRLIGSLLYGVTAHDFTIYAAVLLLLGAVAFIASFLPARRATKVDPMVALRYE